MGGGGPRRGTPPRSRLSGARSVASQGPSSGRNRASRAPRGGRAHPRATSGSRQRAAGGRTHGGARPAGARLLRGRSSRSLRSEASESASAVWMEVLSEAGPASEAGGGARAKGAGGRQGASKSVVSARGGGEDTGTVLSALDDDIEMERRRLLNDQRQAEAQDAARRRDRLEQASEARNSAVQQRQQAAREAAERRIRGAAMQTAAVSAGTKPSTQSAVISEGSPGHVPAGRTDADSPGQRKSEGQGARRGRRGSTQSLSQSPRPTSRARGKASVDRARSTIGWPGRGEGRGRAGRPHSAQRTRRERAQARSVLGAGGRTRSPGSVRSASRGSARDGVAMPQRSVSRSKLAARRGSDAGVQRRPSRGTPRGRGGRRDSSAMSVASARSLRSERAGERGHVSETETQEEAKERRRAVWDMLAAESQAGDRRAAEDEVRAEVKREE